MLGFSVILSLVAAVVLPKVAVHCSLAGWFLNGRFYRYSVTCSQEVSAGSKKCNRNTRFVRKSSKKSDTEVVGQANDAGMNAEKTVIRSADVYGLPWSFDIFWLIDLSCVTLVVFVLYELYVLLLPERASREMNLCIVWVFVLLFSSLRLLTELTAVYFRNELNAGERSVCVSVAAFSFLFSMVLLLFSDRLLAIEIQDGKSHWQLSARSDRSPLLFFCLLSVFYAYLSAVLAFPSFRLARMYRDSLKSDISFLAKCAVKSSIVIPLLLMVIWCKPTVNEIARHTTNFMNGKNAIEATRLLFVWLFIVCRLASAVSCLQSYLDTGLRSFLASKGGGSRINHTDVQQSVNRTFLYFPVVLIQFLVPVMLVVCVSLLLKSLGGVKIVPFASEPRGVSRSIESLNSTSGGNDIGLFRLGRMLSSSVCAEFFDFFLFQVVLMSTMLTFVGFVYVS